MNRRIPPLQALVAATCMAILLASTAIQPLVFAAGAFTPGEVIGDQKQIRNQTQRATDDLNALIEEFEHNGLGEGADVQILKGIRNALGKLSEKEIDKVIALLEEAKKTAKPAETLAAAYREQKGISVQLNQLLVQYQHEQDLADVALRLTRLADRENQNMRAGKALARATGLAGSATFTDVQKAQAQVQESEQQAIYAEAKVLLERLVKLAQKTDDATAVQLNAVVAGAKKKNLETDLSSAADYLHKRQLMSAVGKERDARDTLRDLARLVAPPKEPEEVLKEAAAQLAQAIRDQNYIAQTAKQLTVNDSVNSVTQLDDRSADNVDIADSVRKDVATLVPDAVPDLSKGQDHIQQSRSSLDEVGKLTEKPEKKPQDSATAQAKAKQAADLAADASRKLNDARDKILGQIARIQEQKAAENRIAKEKALLDQIIALRKSEEALQTDTTAAKESKAVDECADRQAKLAATGRDLQKLSVTDAPIVTSVLDAAAREMEGAQKSLANQKPVDAIKPQNIAIEELKKAEVMLAKEIAELQKKKEDLAKLEKARDEVEKMIKDQAKNEQETNKQAANDNKPKENDPTAKDLANNQEKIAKQADQTSKDIKEQAPEASKELADASKNADAAKNELNKPDAASADKKERDAQKNLDNAKSDLDKKIADLKKELGEPNDDAAKLADAEKHIDNAQNDIAQAEQPDPMKALQDTQKKIADDAAKLPQDNPDVKDAAKAADDAAKDLAKNDLDNAEKNMDKAADAMKKAQDPKAKTPQEAKNKLPDLEKRQEDAKNQLAKIKAGEKPDPAKELAEAGEETAEAQAEDSSALPEDAKNALDDAKKALSDAAAAKAANKPDNGATEKAKDALGKAKASIAMAQAGLKNGQKPGKPEPGKPEPGKQGEPLAKVDENNAKQGKGDRKDTNVNANSQTGGTSGDNAASGFAALPPRDRDAIQQSHAEKAPEEYAPMIEQYLKNISDQSSR